MNLFTPDAEPGRPFWWDGVTWPETGGDLPEKTDLLVIGAGYTGLSAAIAAHDAGARVVVIDSGKPGEGASTRNGGMIGAHPRLGWDTLAARYGASVADGLFAEATEALNWVRATITREEMNCDFEECGRLQLAYTDAHFSEQKKLADQMAKKGVGPCRILNRDELQNEIKTPLYKGGLLFEHHSSVDPARYLLGFLQAAQRRGVIVLGNCPAVKTVKVSEGQRVSTPKGAIVADRIVLATNGYTGMQFPWHNRRVFPVPSYLIATEPLEKAQIDALAPGGRMMVETRATHNYFRVSPCGTRIIFGGRASLVDIALPRAARRLYQKLIGIWPSLDGVRLSHVWTGNTGFTFARLPHVGEAGGLHYAMGYSGGGTVLAPWLGRKAALMALDASGSETVFHQTKLQSRWFFRGGRPRFMRPVDLWYRHRVDRREDRDAAG